MTKCAQAPSDQMRSDSRFNFPNDTQYGDPFTRGCITSSVTICFSRHTYLHHPDTGRWESRYADAQRCISGTTAKRGREVRSCERHGDDRARSRTPPESAKCNTKTGEIFHFINSTFKTKKGLNMPLHAFHKGSTQVENIQKKEMYRRVSACSKSNWPEPEFASSHGSEKPCQCEIRQTRHNCKATMFNVADSSEIITHYVYSCKALLPWGRNGFVHFSFPSRGN